ncbi:MAG: hypothetical protein WBP93_00990, partial [Pyrinomonadaceae bacterium]
ESIQTITRPLPQAVLTWGYIQSQSAIVTAQKEMARSARASAVSHQETAHANAATRLAPSAFITY